MRCEEWRARGPKNSTSRDRPVAVALVARFIFVCCFCGADLRGPRLTAAEPAPGLLDLGVVLHPNEPYHVHVGIGEAKFLHFSCMGGPANVVISLASYAEHADPLLFLSLNPDQPPSFQQHDASSFGQWREDAAGNHYVIAKNVNPRGGILGLVNMKHFSGEELDGVLTIHCAAIIAFDGLFWDHLRTSNVCPIRGNLENGHFIEGKKEQEFCSGHGQCEKHGVCECHAEFTGPACEHRKDDMVVAAKGHYHFKVATGHYQYFRVRIPPEFPGGYLEVKVSSTQDPLVVLVRGDDLPTKTNFELSNFDDWVNHRLESVLKYRIPSIQGLAGMNGPHKDLGIIPPTPTIGRHTATHPAGSAGRSLFSARDLSAVPDFCKHIAPTMQSPACKTPEFLQCEANCMSCVKCGKAAGGCNNVCKQCVSPKCLSALALCAGNVTCDGPEATNCEAGCGSCMACFDSNDKGCHKCECCIGCLPLAAKCSVMLRQPTEYNRFAFVGVYNHRRYFNDNVEVDAFATISLTKDPYFEREELPYSWVADLYDPFHDMKNLDITQKQIYPEGDQYIYEFHVKGNEVLHKNVRLYRDRMTLLHIISVPETTTLVLGLTAGHNVKHVLSSSRAAPKTLFDFNRVHKNLQQQVEIDANGGSSLWCAIFGAADSYVEITLTTHGGLQYASMPFNSQLLYFFVILCGLLVLCFIYKGWRKLAQQLSTSSFAGFRRNPHESTASLTRCESFQRYVSSDDIDRSVEDQYLHRGGMGDDGI